MEKIVALREPEVVASKESKATDPDIEATDPHPEKDLQEGRQVGSCPKRMKTKQKTAPEDDKFLEALNKSIKSREQHELGSQDEDSLFMLSLVSTLKKCLLRKIATKIKIMTILEEAPRSMPNIDDRHMPSKLLVTTNRTDAFSKLSPWIFYCSRRNPINDGIQH
ncbi:unnamed protein product [Parnassius apollo]|uniref:(apollo) hypothetical protein n=1 Tax=Parnassius apollo TaxID=110799 RepID=A0A8S3X6Y6_PARAO|nr:unnamed protein product [Parnassius apollo]